MPCPICHSEASRILCDCCRAPRRINSLAGLIYECADCKFIYKETVDQPLDRLADIYQYSVEETSAYFGPILKGYSEASAEVRLYTRVLTEARRRLGSPAHGSAPRLLDVGCATGALLDYSRKFGFDPYGVELNPHFARYASETFALPVVAGELDASCFERGYFDAIALLDLIEHVPDPLAMLNTARELLRPGGLLAVYTPNHRSLMAWLAVTGYRLSGGRLRGPVHVVFGTNHVSFFDHHTLPDVVRRAGFECEAVQRVPYDTERQGEVSGSGILLKTAVGSVEAVARIVNLPYRLLAFARKQVLSGQKR